MRKAHLFFIAGLALYTIGVVSWGLDVRLWPMLCLGIAGILMIISVYLVDKDCREGD